MNIEHRTLNVQHRILYSVNLKIKRLNNPRRTLRAGDSGAPGLHGRIFPSKFCGSLVLKSIKRSVINIQRSMLNVRCSTFNLFTVPATWSFTRAFWVLGSGFKVQPCRWPQASSLIAGLIKNERRTLNIERPTSNNVFCQFKERLRKANLCFEILRFACFKIDKA